jgi:hypothetical protein
MVSIPGTGGLPARRPDQVSQPPVTPVSPGAAAGIVRARQVIVSGIAEGVFVYNGTPAKGNEPIVSITNQSADPFGNPVVPGLDVTQGAITGTVITGSTFSGTDFVINSAGAFFYSGTPAAGNLISSIAGAAGADAFGNAYLAGTTAYVPVTSGAVPLGTYAVNLGLFNSIETFPAITLENLSSASNVPPLIGVGNSSAVCELVLLSGRTITADPVSQLLLQSADTAGTSLGLATLTGSMRVNGSLQCVGAGLTGDINVYDTERLTPGNGNNTQSITSTTLTLITGLTCSVAAATYRINGQVYWQQTTGAFAQSLAFANVAWTGRVVTRTYAANNGSSATVGIYSVEAISAAAITLPGLAAGVIYVTEFWGIMTFTGSGTFQVQAAEGTAGDAWEIQSFSWIDMMPAPGGTT